MYMKRDCESPNDSSNTLCSKCRKEQDYSFANNKEVIIASILAMFFVIVIVGYLIGTQIMSIIKP